MSPVKFSTADTKAYSKFSIRCSSVMHVYRAESPIIFVPPPPVPRTHEYWWYIVPSNYYGGDAHDYIIMLALFVKVSTM